MASSHWLQRLVGLILKRLRIKVNQSSKDYRRKSVKVAPSTLTCKKLGKLLIQLANRRLEVLPPQISSLNLGGASGQVIAFGGGGSAGSANFVHENGSQPLHQIELVMRVKSKSRKYAKQIMNHFYPLWHQRTK